jgi:hypothetical protein
VLRFRPSPSVPREAYLHEQLAELDRDSHAHLGADGAATLGDLIFVILRVEGANRVRGMIAVVRQQKPAAGASGPPRHAEPSVSHFISEFKTIGAGKTGVVHVIPSMRKSMTVA